jgi:ATP-dependent Lon protease
MGILIGEPMNDQTVLPSPESDSPLPETVAILPLDQYVLFPGMLAPVVIGEEKSRILVEEVLRRDDRRVGVLTKASDGEGLGTFAALTRVGTVAAIFKAQKTPDGSWRVLLQGLRRFTVVENLAESPYLRARIAPIPEEPASGPHVDALFIKIRELVHRIVDLSSVPDELKGAINSFDNPIRLPDFVAANIPLRTDRQLELLRCEGTIERLELLLQLLANEVHVLEIGDQIQSKVRSTIDQNQREFVLREQMRAIRRELGEDDGGPNDLERLRARIEEKGLPEQAKAAALREVARLENIPTASPEYSIARTYVETVLDLPWNEATSDNLDLNTARAILEKHHEGLKPVKDRILESLAVRRLNPDLRGQILCFIGPPGTGKTSLGRSIAEALGRKFQRLSLGGVRDEAEIRGHRRTYIGAMPGRILKCMKAAGTVNPVILLDEIDKVGSDWRGDPSSALLEVLDPEQNSTFSDHYLDVPYDLSKVLFLTTANYAEGIPEPLYDRMEVIEVPGYTMREKAAIARKHLIPRQMEIHGLSKSAIRWRPGSIERIIESYTREAGVRNLERQLATVCRKVARKIVEDDNILQKGVDLSPELIQEMLGPAKFVPETVDRTATPGVSVGLAWTSFGGDILFIEVTRTAGKGNLLLTGQLGDVMKESAQAAFTYLRSCAASLGLTAKDFEESDFHIHVPAGATPKDGPSAGIAIASALASILTGRVIRPRIAMTGEITLRGNILPVGGIREKVLAAHRAGIRDVYLPERNKPDVSQLPKDATRGIRIHHVGKALDLIQAVLAPSRSRSTGKALPPAAESDAPLPMAARGKGKSTGRTDQRKSPQS